MTTSEEARWFIAEVLVLHAVPACNQFLLHNNFVLLRAGNANQALILAEQRGREYDDTFTNTDGNRVEVNFVGLRNLHEVYDDISHGAELLYEEFLVSSGAEAAAFKRESRDFAVYREEPQDPLR